MQPLWRNHAHEPLVRIELTTPSLPWKCSATELKRRAGREKTKHASVAYAWPNINGVRSIAFLHFVLEPTLGFEPRTFRLQVGCSIQLKLCGLVR